MFCFFFFNDTATTEIYTLSLHDALPICFLNRLAQVLGQDGRTAVSPMAFTPQLPLRSEEHTSELQSPCNLVCRLLLEKKKMTRTQKLRANVNNTAFRTVLAPTDPRQHTN